MSIELVMTSNHLILYRLLLLLPSIFPSIRVFSKQSFLHIRWPKYWSFSFIISPSNEYSGLISFRMDWLDLLAVQGILKRVFSTPRWGLFFPSRLLLDMSISPTWLKALMGNKRSKVENPNRGQKLGPTGQIQCSYGLRLAQIMILWKFKHLEEPGVTPRVDTVHSLVTFYSSFILFLKLSSQLESIFLCFNFHQTWENRSQWGIGISRKKMEVSLWTRAHFYVFYLFIYFWLCWAFFAACGLSLVARSRAYSSLQQIWNINCKSLWLPW